MGAGAVGLLDGDRVGVSGFGECKRWFVGHRLSLVEGGRGRDSLGAASGQHVAERHTAPAGWVSPAPPDAGDQQRRG